MSNPKAVSNVLSDYRHALGYFRRQWRRLSVLVALCLLTSGLAVLQPWPLKLLVDTALGSQAPPAWLESLGLTADSSGALIVIAAAASFLAYALSSLADVAMTYGWMRSGQRMAYDVAADLYDKLQARSLAHRHTRTLGDSLNRLFGDSWSLYTIAYALLTVPLQHAVTIVAIGLVAWSVDPTLTLIAVGVVPAATALSYVLAQWLRRLARDEASLTSDIMSLVQQTLSAIPLIQTYWATRHTDKVYRGLAGRGVDIAKRSALVKEGVLLVSGVTLAGATSAVLFVGGHKVLSGEITLGVLVVFLAYLKTINHSVEACLNGMAKVIAANAGLARVCEILNEDSGMAESADAVPYRSPSSQRRGRITFDAVSFAYPGRELVLDGIDLDIEPGQTVALVGPSGEGKSTLVSLIPRFFDPEAGRILIDGQDLRSLTLSSLRAQISVVLQEPFLLPMSVADNIAYDPKDYSRDEAVAAAVAVGAHDFIRALPQGFDTMLGEHGAELSGGQKQLIAISRALLKDAPILIMDEPTSALDVETETKVMRGLHKLMADRTTIIVAHRLSTIRSADRIILVRDGGVRELESLAELDGHMRGSLAR
jgi:ATP-binding cassette subfamily B protein/subfamily B ATP-binding cassette protein MsbA